MSSLVLFTGAWLLSCSGPQDDTASSPGQAPMVLTIGLVPEINIFEQKRRYQPIIDYLNGRLGIEVRSLVLERYGGIVDAFEAGDIDAAFHGSFGYLLLQEVADVEPIARPEWQDGTSTYSGYLVARRDSGLEADVQGWRGKRLALVHKTTTAGYFFPLSYLKSQGVVDLDGFLGSMEFFGSHEAAALAVFRKEADIAGVKNQVFNRLAEQNPAFADAMVVLVESAEVPSNTLSVKRSLDPALRQRLREVLLGMAEDPAGKAALDQFGARRFLETRTEDFAAVLQIVQESGYAPSH